MVWSCIKRRSFSEFRIAFPRNENKGTQKRFCLGGRSSCVHRFIKSMFTRERIPRGHMTFCIIFIAVLNGGIHLLAKDMCENKKPVQFATEYCESSPSLSLRRPYVSEFHLPPPFRNGYRCLYHSNPHISKASRKGGNFRLIATTSNGDLNGKNQSHRRRFR